jgi:hypothetical protein
MIKGDRAEFPLEGMDSLSDFLRKKSHLGSLAWICIDMEISQVFQRNRKYIDRDNWKAILTRTAEHTYKLDIVAVSRLYRNRETVELSYEIKTRVWEIMPYLGEKIASITNLITREQLK